MLCLSSWQSQYHKTVLSSWIFIKYNWDKVSRFKCSGKVPLPLSNLALHPWFWGFLNFKPWKHYSAELFGGSRIHKVHTGGFSLLEMPMSSLEPCLFLSSLSSIPCPQYTHNTLCVLHRVQSIQHSPRPLTTWGKSELNTSVKNCSDQ